MRDRRKPTRATGGTPSLRPRATVATPGPPPARREQPPSAHAEPRPRTESNPVRQVDKIGHSSAGGGCGHEAGWRRVTRAAKRLGCVEHGRRSLDDTGMAAPGASGGIRPGSQRGRARRPPPRRASLRRRPGRAEPSNGGLALEPDRERATHDPRLGRSPPQVTTGGQGSPPSGTRPRRAQRLSGHDRRPHARRPRRDDDVQPNAEGVRRRLSRAAADDDGRRRSSPPRPQGQRPAPPRRRVVHPRARQGGKRRRGAPPAARHRALRTDAGGQRVGVRLQGRLRLARAASGGRGRQPGIPLGSRVDRRGSSARHEASPSRLDRSALLLAPARLRPGRRHRRNPSRPRPPPTQLSCGVTRRARLRFGRRSARRRPPGGSARRSRSSPAGPR